MSKKMLFSSGLCILIIMIVLYFLNRGPNPEQQATHTATVCNTINKLSADADRALLIEETERYFKKSTPSYALKQPKYFKSFVNSKINLFLAQSPAEQTAIRQDYQYCFKTLSTD